MHKINLHYVTLTNYDDNFKGINIVFEKDNLSETLGEILDRHNKNQIRIAETEKSLTLTFFLFWVDEKNLLKMKPEYYVIHQKLPHTI